MSSKQLWIKFDLYLFQYFSKIVAKSNLKIIEITLECIALIRNISNASIHRSAKQNVRHDEHTILNNVTSITIFTMQLLSFYIAYHFRLKKNDIYEKVYENSPTTLMPQWLNETSIITIHWHLLFSWLF